MALTYTPQGELQSKLPNFSLTATNGKTYSAENFKDGKPLVVMFICNHCPYVQAIEARLIDLASRFRNEAHFIAICSNDSEEYPEDSFLEMKNKAEKMGYPFLYLHDESQSVARSFGAVCTPDLYVYDGDQRLCYRGRLDDSWKDASKVTRKELEWALTELLAGQDISRAEQNPSMGCLIKWK